MLQEFKKFLIKGNAIDMAVGFIFGAAFATVVKSFVNNIIMPPIGYVLGGIDFSKFTYILVPATENSEAVEIKYGVFIGDVISFIILGFIIFMMVRTINSLKKEEPPKPAKKAPEVELLEEIRDLLKQKA